MFGDELGTGPLWCQVKKQKLMVWDSSLVLWVELTLTLS